MSRGTLMLMSVALTAVGVSVGQAQSALPPTAPATPTQIYTGVSPYSRISPSTTSAGAISGGTDTATSQPGNVGPYPSPGFKSDHAIWYPSITGAAFYDDNVFARHTNRQGDWAGVVRPELAWRSYGLENIDVVGSAYVDQRWYNRFTSEDQLNGGAVLGSTVRAGENTQVITRFAVVHGHEDRGTSDSINTAFLRPLSYDQFDGAGAINQRYGRWWTSVGAAASFVHFGTGILAGAPVVQDYRDGAIVTTPVRLGYVVAPLTSLFAEVAYNKRDFRVDAFDSEGWRVVGGALFEPGPGSRIKGEIFGGYMTQAYSGFGFQTVSTFTYGSSLAFLLTPQLTATLEGRRDAREASLSGGAAIGTPGDGVSVVESVVAGRMDYAVLSNLIVGGGVAYLQDDYLTAGRSDRAVSPLASLKYYPNRYLSLGFDYRYLNFDSTGVGVLGYYRNVYLFSANLKL